MSKGFWTMAPWSGMIRIESSALTTRWGDAFLVIRSLRMSLHLATDSCSKATSSHSLSLGYAVEMRKMFLVLLSPAIAWIRLKRGGGFNQSRCSSHKSYTSYESTEKKVETCCHKVRWDKSGTTSPFKKNSTGCRQTKTYTVCIMHGEKGNHRNRNPSD